MELSLDFIKQLKQRILTSRYLVAKMANAEALQLYFSIGQMVEETFENNKWGAKSLMKSHQDCNRNYLD
jgi:hypothetical protein